MKREIGILAVLCLLMSLVLPAGVCAEEENWIDYAQAVEVDGTVYEIRTAEELAWIAQETNGGNDFSGKTVRLMDDLHLEGKEWTAIGQGGRGIKFIGTLDGNHKTISGLTLTQSTEGSGLFKIFSGVVYDLKMTGVNIDSEFQSGALASSIKDAKVLRCSTEGKIMCTAEVGGLAGRMSRSDLTDCHTRVEIITIGRGAGGLAGHSDKNSTIEGCSASGKIQANGYVGGLVGINNAFVWNSYSTADVVGTETVGGLIGSNSVLAGPRSCYAAGRVSGGAGIGGLIGVNQPANYQYENQHISNCYFIGQVVGSRSTSGALIGQMLGYTNYVFENCYYPQIELPPVGNYQEDSSFDPEVLTMLTEEEMKTASFLRKLNEGLAAARWRMAGAGEKNEGFPTLMQEQTWMTQAEPVAETNEQGQEGEGWYLIRTAPQLAFLAQQSYLKNETFQNKTILLQGDIDLGGRYWDGIGGKSAPFGGIFNGNGHTVKGLCIDRLGQYTGLFGKMDGAEVKNLRLEQAVVRGGDFAGGIAGESIDGTITNCIVTGSVWARSVGGGLVGSFEGELEGGGIVDCRAEATVTCLVEGAGGAAGWFEGTMERCVATGAVNGKDYTGGLIGNGTGTLRSCSAEGTVTATGEYAGGLIGQAYSLTAANCRALGDVNGMRHVGGLMGEMDADSQIQYSFSAGSVTADEMAGGLVGRLKGGVFLKCYFNADADQIVGGTARSDEEKLANGDGSGSGFSMKEDEMKQSGFANLLNQEQDPAVWSGRDGAYPVPGITTALAIPALSGEEVRITTIKTIDGRTDVMLEAGSFAGTEKLMVSLIRYDGSGKVVQSSAAVRTQPGERIQVSLPSTAAGGTIKLFLWDAETMQPLTGNLSV